MPASYPIPPWLHGVSAGEIGQLYEGGLRTGVSAAEAQARTAMEAQRMAQQFSMEQQRLAQEREIAQMQTQVRQQQLQAESARQSQQLEMTKAYHDQVTGLRMAELDEQKQRVQLASQTAAQTFAARQGFQQDLVEAGDDPAKQRRAALKWGPMLQGMGGVMSKALGDNMMGTTGPVQSVSVLDPISHQPMEGVYGVRSASGKGMDVRNAPRPANAGLSLRDELNGLHWEVKTLTDDPDTLKDKEKQKELARAMGRIHEIMTNAPKASTRSAAATSTGTAGGVPPVAQRVTGQIYQTPKGPHQWTGKGWKPVGKDVAPQIDTGSDEEEED
jgi:hypothetical protein